MANPPSKLASINGDSLLKEQISAIKALLNAAGRQKTFRTYQLLPRHRRRRIMSWSIRCIPRVFKTIAKREALAPPPKLSRKARRHRSLCRLRVFFAKRFSIRIRNSIRMPVHSNQKQLRYVERTLLSGAVCYCNLQQRYAIIHIQLEESANATNTVRHTSILKELRWLREQNSSSFLLLGGFVPAFVSYIDDAKEPTSVSRYLVSYNILDEDSIRRWFPMMQSLPDMIHITVMARQRDFKPGLYYDLETATRRVCNTIARRIWGYSEYLGLRTARDLTQEARLRSCYPNPSTTSDINISSAVPCNYFISDLAANNLTSSIILHAFRISKLALAPLGEPPEWKQGSRNALRYKVQNASLELFNEHTLLQLTKEMEVYMSNDSIRKLRVMQLLSSDTRKDPLNMLSHHQAHVDEGEVIVDGEDCTVTHADSEPVPAAYPSSLDRKEHQVKPTHVDVVPISGNLGNDLPSTDPMLSLRTSIIVHPILNTPQFASLSFAVSKEEAQPLLLGLVRDGIPILGEREVQTTVSNLFYVPFIPTTIAPSTLYYNFSFVLDAFIMWTKRPRNKRSHSYTPRSILWYIFQLARSDEFERSYLQSPIAICFDFVLEDVCKELYNQCYPLRKAAAKQDKDIFLQWITTPAIKLDQSGFNLNKKYTKENLDISATIMRLENFVESLPARSFELDSLLHLAMSYTRILSLTLLHKYSYGHILKVKPINNTLPEAINAVVLQCSYSVLMGRCLAIVLFVFTEQQLMIKDSISTDTLNEFHIEGEQFTSRLHWA